MKDLSRYIPSVFVCIFIVLWLWALPYGSFGDEHENFTAGWLISQGLLPYRDFFFHHAPLPFFLATPFFWFSSTPWVAIRGIILLAWLVTTGCVYAFVHQRLRITWGVLLLGAAITAPALLGQMYLAESILTPVFAGLVFLLAEIVLNPQKKLSKLPWFLVILSVASGVLVWSTIVSIPAVAVIWLGTAIFFLKKHSPNKVFKTLKPQTKQIVATLGISAFGIPAIFAATGALRDFWWGVVQYNTQYYFSERLAQDEAQQKYGYLYAVVAGFFTQTAQDLSSIFGNTLVAAQTSVTLLKLSLTGQAPTTAQWQVMLTEWYTHTISLEHLITLALVIVFVTALLAKRWFVAIWFLVFCMALRARDNELFKFAPLYLSILASYLLMLQTMYKHKRTLLTAILAVLPVLWLVQVTPHYVQHVTAQQALFTPQVLETSAVLRAEQSPTLLCLCRNPAYYVLAQKIPSQRYLYYHPWFAAAPGIETELATYLQQNTTAPVILESDVVGNDMEFAASLENIVRQNYSETRSGVYHPQE